MVGYAEALFKLGRRYETGLSWKRNLPEAVRCYRKSAKLGNRKALLQVSLPPPPPLRVLELAPDEIPPIDLRDLEELLPPPTSYPY